MLCKPVVCGHVFMSGAFLSARFTISWALDDCGSDSYLLTFVECKDNVSD